MPTTPQDFASLLTSVIIAPIEALLFGAAIAVFLWGIVQFLIAQSQGKDSPEGKMHMLWGIVGLFIMTAAVAIVQIATNTFGIPIPH